MISPTEPRCGDCTVCCQIEGFTGPWAYTDKYNEAEKFGIKFDPFNTCNKLCDTGCSIQENKPRICSEFFCSYIEHDLDEVYYPKNSGFVAHIDLDMNPDLIIIISKDMTLPPEIQYDNNKKLLDDLVEEIQVCEGRRFRVQFITKQGDMLLR
tara:strand:- start:1949 stop:2407 length:459 start_codon:yes stop_codon:yes gene_type:complete